MRAKVAEIFVFAERAIDFVASYCSVVLIVFEDGRFAFGARFGKQLNPVLVEYCFELSYLGLSEKLSLMNIFQVPK